jgi:hypothetical protein
MQEKAGILISHSSFSPAVPRCGMVVVKRCGTLEEAYLCRNLLAESGIESDVLDEATATTAPYLLTNTGVRLAVADEDADRACATLGVPRREPVAPPRRGGLPAWVALVVGAAAITVVIGGMKQSRVSPAPDKSDLDRNGDGKTDCREIRDGDGRLLERWLDQNFDTRWDVHERYAGGQPAVTEQDTDFDGSYDRRGEFRQGVLTGETITPGGAGNPLFRLDYRHGVLSAVWSDPDRDGRWNERADYDPMGRESARVPMR